MNRRLGLLAALLAAVAAQAFLGWWALVLVGFCFGFLANRQPWPSLWFGGGVLLLGAARLAWLQYSGAQVTEMHRILAESTSLPVLLLSLGVPALAGLCGVALGAAMGRRILFS